MEQRPPKRRGRPPKNPNAIAQRPKKPIVKPPVADRRQTRLSRTVSGLASTTARKNVGTIQDSSDYQITLVDVKSSYNKESGIFMISGLRRGMMEIGPWSSAVIEHAPLGKHLREEDNDEPYLARGSPKRPRIEIDLTLSDSDDAARGKYPRVPAKLSPSPLSMKRKVGDGEDTLELPFGGKRQKTSVHPSTQVGLDGTRIALSTEEASSLTTPLMDPMEASKIWQGMGFKEEDGVIDLTPSSPIIEQGASPSLGRPVQAPIDGESSQVAANTDRVPEVGDQVSKVAVSTGSGANLHIGEATATASILGAEQSSASNRATENRYMVLEDGDSEAANDIHALEDTASERADIRGPPQWHFEKSQPVGDPLESGQLMETTKHLVTKEARFDWGESKNEIKSELAGSSSTTNTPVYLHEFTKPVQPLAIATQRIVNEEQTVDKQQLHPEAQVIPAEDIKECLEQQTGLEKLLGLGEQRMTPELQPILGKQVVTSTGQEILTKGFIPEEEPTALIEQNVPGEQDTFDGQALSKQYAGGAFERKAPQEQTAPDRKTVPDEGIKAIGLKTAGDLAISDTQKILEEKVMLEEEAEVLVEKRIPIEPVAPEVESVVLAEQEVSKEKAAHDEQTVTPMVKRVSIEQDTPHDERALSKKQKAIGCELVIPYEYARTIGEQPIHDKGAAFLDEQIISNKKTLSGDEPVEPNEQVFFHKQAISNEQSFRDEEVVVTTRGQDVRDEKTISSDQVVPTTEGEIVTLGKQDAPDGEAVIFNERDIPSENAIAPSEHATRGQESIASGHVIPSSQIGPSQKDIEKAANDLMSESVDGNKGFAHSPRPKRFSGDLAASSQRELLEPPYVSKECPICKKDFQDMSTQDLRHHVLSCLEEERPQPTERADDEHLGLTRRATTPLEDLGPDDGAKEDEDEEGLHIDGEPILLGPLKPIAGFRDTTDSGRIQSTPLSDDEQLPGPYEEDISTDENQSPIVSNIEAVASSKFRTITDPEKFLASLQDPEDKSTRSLYRSVQNAAGALKIWQDEWMAIETRVARLQQRKAHNPRAVLDPVVFEDQKEADLYGYKWDPNPKKRGLQDPIAQRTGRMVGGRELRRRAPGMKALPVDSDAGTQDGGKRTRSRRGDGASDPNASGVDSGRLAGTQNSMEASLTRRSTKRTADLMDADTPEQSDAPKRRGRPRLNPLPPRIQDIRSGNAFSATSTESEGTPAPVIKRRGRPPKNFKPIKPPANQTVRAKAGNVEAGKAKQRTEKAGSNGTPGTPAESGPSEVVKKPKSEKRSAAMQAWWDRRKALERAQAEAAAAAAAAAATVSANTGPQVIGSGAQKIGAGRPKEANADRGDTPLPQKRRGRPPKQSATLVVETTELENKVFQPKRRGRPPKSVSKGPLAKPTLNVGGAANVDGLTSAPNPPLRKHTEFGQYQQLVDGSGEDKSTKKRRNVIGDDASSSSKRLKVSPPSFDADSEGMQSTDSSDGDIDDDGDDSYYG